MNVSPGPMGADDFTNYRRGYYEVAQGAEFYYQSFHRTGPLTQLRGPWSGACVDAKFFIDRDGVPDHLIQ